MDPRERLAMPLEPLITEIDEAAGLGLTVTPLNCWLLLELGPPCTGSAPPPRAKEELFDTKSMILPLGALDDAKFSTRFPPLTVVVPCRRCYP